MPRPYFFSTCWCYPRMGQCLVHRHLPGYVNSVHATVEQIHGCESFTFSTVRNLRSQVHVYLHCLTLTPVTLHVCICALTRCGSAPGHAEASEVPTPNTLHCAVRSRATNHLCRPEHMNIAHQPFLCLYPALSRPAELSLPS